MTVHQADKPYQLTLEERGEYLYAYVNGPHDSYQISILYWTEIANRLRELSYDKVLIVEDIEENSSLTDVFQLVSELASIGYTGATVAFVDRYSTHSDLNDFGVLVGTNRGLYGKAFADEASAEEWLLAQ